MTRSLLALDADGELLRCAVARKGRGAVHLERFAEFAGSDHDVLLDSVLTQLGCATPRRAALVTDLAVGAVASTTGPERFRPSDHVCGWTAAAGYALFTEMPRAARDAWTSLFARRGIRLLGIYPRLAAVAAAADASRTRERAIVHLDGATLACLDLRDGIVRHLKVLALARVTDTQDACAAAAALLPRGEIFVCGRGEAPAHLAAALSTSRDAILLDPCPVAPGGGAGWAALLGAARHALRAAPAMSIPYVPPDDATRLTRHPRFRWLPALVRRRAAATGH